MFFVLSIKINIPYCLFCLKDYTMQLFCYYSNTIYICILKIKFGLMFMFRNVQSLKHTKSKIVVFAGFCFNITFLNFEFICIYTICVWTRLLNVKCVGRRVDCFSCNQSNLLIVRLYLWVPPSPYSQCIVYR